MTAFIVFGFASQLALLAFFASHLAKSPLEAPLGRVVYGLGLVALGLGGWLVLTGEPWHLALACGLYVAWAALGTWFDLVRPIQWREPPRWAVLAPYAALLVTALLAFWVPLWWVDRRLWFVFGVLYAAHTTLNALSHRGTPRGRTPHPR